MKLTLYVLFSLITLSAISQEGVKVSEDSYQYYGEKISADGALTMSDLYAKLAKNDSVFVKVQGTVSEVCQTKGCWMTIQGDDDDGMLVQFLDYGFFVPKDISNREIIIEGSAKRELTSVDELRHYAEDEGKSAEEIAAITEPQVQLKFLASGVILLPKGQ